MASNGPDDTAPDALQKKQGDFARSQSLDSHGFPLVPKRKTHSDQLDSHSYAEQDYQAVSKRFYHS